MEQTLNFIQVIQDMVLNPSLGSAVVLFLTSFVNELVALLPYAVILSGQLIFLNEPLSWALFMKLLVYVSIPIGVGSALGSLVFYGLAYFGGKPAIDKFQKYIHFSWEDVEKINMRFRGAWYDEILFLFLRSIPVLPALPVNLAAGILRMRFWPYLILTTIGFTIRMILTLVIVGVGMESLSELLFFLYNQ
ncbi:MAG: VTT domain-containing protein [bacterium]|nr:VTT domain-containing protein [bacterium]